MLKRTTSINCKFIRYSTTLGLLLLIFILGCNKKETFSTRQAAHSSADKIIPARNKPNIILILGDDVGYEIPTVDGGQSYATPNIDRLAQMGMRFTRFHASPLCSPSRFMLLTGKYNFRNYNGWGIMDTSNNTIADLLAGVGYKTYVAGKWQLDGGDVSVHGLGFSDYLIWSPFTPHNNAISAPGAENKSSRYKDPVLYKDAAFLPPELTQGKYGDDIFTDSVNNFIDKNKTNPFFIYFPICLVHYPFSPTPDDADFATWDPLTSTPNKKYFPSMVSYMDKKIGEIIDKVQSSGIANNTLVIFIGDNGTDERITSQFNDESIKGGKNHTTEYGTRVPMIIWWQGKIAASSVSDDILDLTDIMPTFASLAGTVVPSSYGIIDGKNFVPVLKGSLVPPRKWIFCHFDPDMAGNPTSPKRWVQDTAYKLYDSTGLFYHYSNDLFELSPLTQLTAREQKIKQAMQLILSTMHN